MLPSKYVEQGWCKYNFAKNSDGIVVDSRHITAEQWCIEGALQVSLFTTGITQDQYNYMRENLQQVLGVKNLASWNDTPEREKYEVVNILHNIENNLHTEMHHEKELILV